MIFRGHTQALLSIVAATIGFSTIAADLDVGSAEALARKSNCFKCHDLDKPKKGSPPWKEIAAKYRGKPEGEARLITHITTGEKAKFADGHEEEHVFVKSKDQNEIKNLVDWILSLSDK